VSAAEIRLVRRHALPMAQARALAERTVRYTLNERAKAVIVKMKVARATSR
jgi:hypothetical protein